jgi:hypothetical protein
MLCEAPKVKSIHRPWQVTLKEGSVQANLVSDKYVNA